MKAHDREILLDILFDKKVDVSYLEHCCSRYKTIAMKEYNHNVGRDRQLTEVEFDLLREWILS